MLSWGAAMVGLWRRGAVQVRSFSQTPPLSCNFVSENDRLDHDYSFLLRADDDSAGTPRGGLHGGPGSTTITCVW